MTEASRVAFAAGLTNWVAANNALHGMENTPAVLLADLNSTRSGSPTAAQKILTNSGWVDAFTAPTKTNVRYSTIAENPANGNTGWPVNAYLFPKTKANPQGYATRIDYIMGFGPGLTMVSYEHVIYLNGAGVQPGVPGVRSHHGASRRSRSADRRRPIVGLVWRLRWPDFSFPAPVA